MARAPLSFSSRSSRRCSQRLFVALFLSSCLAHAQVAPGQEPPEATIQADEQSSEGASKEPDSEQATPNPESSVPPEDAAPATQPTRNDSADDSGSDSTDDSADDSANDSSDDFAGEKKALTDASVLTEAETPEDKKRREQDKPATRWSEAGAFVGLSIRPSSSDRFKYRPGIAYGGFFRPQITDYLAVRLSYREERIPVSAQPGAFDYNGASSGLDLRQPDLKVTSLGLRIEPSLHLTEHIHLVGVLSWSWARFVAPMPEAENFHQRADRAGVELNWGLGGGFGIDLLRNWVNLSILGAYHFATHQTGSAYDPVQAIVDGQMTQFAPLSRPKSLVDVLFSVGIIL